MSTLSEVATLDELVERIAARVVELFDEAAGGESLLTAATLADRLGVDRGYVYEHADRIRSYELVAETVGVLPGS